MLLGRHATRVRNRRRVTEPGFLGDGEHRWGVDDADRVPGEEGVAGVRPVHSRRDRHVQLSRQPGQRAVAAKAGAVVFGSVLMVASGEPAALAAVRAPAGRAPSRQELVGGDADLHRPFPDRLVEDGGVRPVYCKDRAVIVGMVDLREPAGLHPHHDFMQIGAVKHVVGNGPGDHGGVGDEDLGRIAGLGEGLLGRDAVPAVIVAPHGDLFRNPDEVRRRGLRRFETRGHVGHGCGEQIAWSGDRAPLGAILVAAVGHVAILAVGVTGVMRAALIACDAL